MSFIFRGKIPSSKSLFNRALILKSFYPKLNLEGLSESEDIDFLNNSIDQLLSDRSDFYVGESGTGLRFLMGRLSRLKGEFTIRAHSRLLNRPHDALIQVLNQLGCQIKKSETSVKISSTGWLEPKEPLRIGLNVSSQFLSSLLLSSWELPFDLKILIEPSTFGFLQDSYSGMTLSFLKKAGLEIQIDRNILYIPKMQRSSLNSYQVEPDWSSAAAILMAAQIGGDVILQECYPNSLQPDSIILSLLKKMNGNCEFLSNQVRASRASRLISLQSNFESCPDLVPCLAVTCSFAEGESILSELSKLVYKESNRIRNTVNLLQLAGVLCDYRNDALIIQGLGTDFIPKTFRFNPDQDHRMAMAAGLFKLRNPKIQIESPEVVNKSFKNFWNILNLAYDI